MKLNTLKGNLRLYLRDKPCRIIRTFMKDFTKSYWKCEQCGRTAWSNFACIIAFLSLVGIFIFTLEFGQQRKEQWDCRDWQAHNLQGQFQPTDWQVEQCNRYNIQFKP